MTLPTSTGRPASGPDPTAPRRRSAGRPVRRQWPLTPLQARLLLAGLALLGVLFYLVAWRSQQDPQVRLEGDRIDVELREFSITPQSVSIPAGSIEIYATNRGTEIHNLVIETIVSRAAGERPERQLAIPAMRPGETKSGNVTLPSGKYRWRSSMPNDDDLGMYGTLEVRQQ